MRFGKGGAFKPRYTYIVHTQTRQTKYEISWEFLSKKGKGS